MLIHKHKKINHPAMKNAQYKKRSMYTFYVFYPNTFYRFLSCVKNYSIRHSILFNTYILFK